MQRVIYVCLIIAGAFYILPVPARRRHRASRASPTSPRNASSLRWDRSLGSPTLDGLRGLDSDIILFWRWLLNSVIVTVCVVLGRVFLCALAGYSLARIRFPGYQLVFALILAVMMVPPIILAIPRFILLKELGHDQHLRRADPADHGRRRGHLRDEAVHGADPRRDRGGRGDRRRRSVRRRSPRSSSRSPARR